MRTQYICVCVCVCVCVLVAQLCLTLCDPMDCSPPASDVRGILQTRILEWVAILLSKGSSQPRDQTWVSCIASMFFTILGWALNLMIVVFVQSLSFVQLFVSPWTAAHQAFLSLNIS